MITPPDAEDIDVYACVDGNKIDLTVERRQPTNAPIDWDGNSFKDASFTQFDDASGSYPAMTLSGQLSSANTLNITVAANGGTTMMEIPLIDNNGCAK